MSFQPLTIDSDWARYRTEYHRRYETLAGLQDASRLGYVHGPETVLSEDDIVERWRRAAGNKDRRRDAVNHVYIHVPFCKSICSFCNYERLRPSDPKLLHEFTDRILTSLSRIGPAVAPMTWHTLYMGGGTPSTLPPKQLDRILSEVDRSLRWHPQNTRSFEFDPAVFNEAKLDVLVDHGFTHFTFGVQTLTASINQDHNRGAQSADMVSKRFDEIHARGITNISCDFLMGLKGTTPEQIVSEVERVLAHRPRWVDMFFLTPTPEYIESHFEGSYEAFWTHIKPFHDRIPAMVREMAAKHRYAVRRGHGHNIVVYRRTSLEEAHKQEGIFAYTQLVDQQRRPLHLLGLGTSARSMIFGQAQIECRDPSELGNREGDHYYVGHEWGMEGEVRQFLVHVLRENDEIDRAMFRRIFGLDITEAIPLPLSVWASQGKLAVDDDKIQLKREARRDRMRTLLWLLPDIWLDHEVRRHERNLRRQQKSTESEPIAAK